MCCFLEKRGVTIKGCDPVKAKHKSSCFAVRALHARSLHAICAANKGKTFAPSDTVYLLVFFFVCCANFAWYATCDAEQQAIPTFLRAKLLEQSTITCHRQEGLKKGGQQEASGGKYPCWYCCLWLLTLI